MTLRALVEDRIKATVTAFKEVAGAADIKSILAGRVSYPACYIYRERNQATTNESCNFVSQQRTESVALIVTTRNVQDARGGINSDECEEYCNLIEEQLLGWQPDNYYSPMTYSEGGLLLLMDGFHYWREVYKTTSTIRGIL